jgi:hypothetical protein
MVGYLRLTPPQRPLPFCIIAPSRLTPQECSSERSCGKHGQLPSSVPSFLCFSQFSLFSFPFCIIAPSRLTPQECSSERSCGTHGQLAPSHSLPALPPLPFCIIVPSRLTPQECSSERSCVTHGQLPSSYFLPALPPPPILHHFPVSFDPARMLVRAFLRNAWSATLVSLPPCVPAPSHFASSSRLV